jgi:hypothetical protein
MCGRTDSVPMKTPERLPYPSWRGFGAGHRKFKRLRSFDW